MKKINNFFIAPCSHSAEMPVLANPLNTDSREGWAPPCSLFTENAKTSIFGEYRFIGEIYCALGRSSCTFGPCRCCLDWKIQILCEAIN